jgi:prepilin-type N-terminal cleavage/methylation domain-containing protein
MKIHEQYHRQAFTLVELLVVLAIVGILVSLLVPATQAAREASRRVSCQSNLRQSGIALLNFESVHRFFPASGSTKPGPGSVSGSFLSWRVLCLPFIEQSNLADHYRLSEVWWHEDNLNAGSISLSTFVCPSTPNQPPILNALEKPPRPTLVLSKPLATSDYETIMSVRPIIDVSKYNATNRFSVMHRDSRNNFVSIRDGSSQTIIVSESAARPSVYRRGKPQPQLFSDQGFGWIDSESSFSLDGASPDGSHEGCGAHGGCMVAMNARNDNEPYSFHIGGTFALFADGHISFESESISLFTFAAQITRAAED